MQLFSRDNVNSGRQNFLDVAKTLSIFFMILIHVYEESDCKTFPLLEKLILMLFGGVFAAPVFMFCAGIGIVFSQNSTPPQLAKRGLSLYAKNWILSFVRAVIPATVILLLTGNDEMKNLIAVGIASIDIMCFAGLAFLLEALFKKLNFSSGAILLISVAMSVLGSFVRNIECQNWFAGILIGHFFGTDCKNVECAFPFFNWMIFIGAGQFFGTHFKRCNSPSRLFKIILPIALCIFLPGLIFGLKNSVGIFASLDDYYQMTTIDAIFALSAVFLLLSGCFFAAPRISERAMAFFGETSRNINTIYVIQWIVINWTFNTLQHVLKIIPPVSIVFLSAIAIFTFSVCLARKVKGER